MVRATMEPEFAPQYSPKERRRRLLLHGVLCVLMVSAVYWWALPRYRAFAGDAACEAIFGIPASTVLIHGAFVGVPLAAAILIVILTGRASIEAIATRRYPPPGRKVYGRFKVKRGWQAVAFALVPAMFITYLCVLSSQGIATAARMSRESQSSAECHSDANREVPARSNRSRQESSQTENRRPAR